MNRPAPALRRDAFVAGLATLAAFAPRTRASAATADLTPLFHAREGWLNGALTPDAARGKVVVVDVFTFDCYNCKNVVPTLRRLNASRGDDLLVAGIHAPETPYERERAHIVANLHAQEITWPVALDGSFALWRSYGVDAWPTQLFFDRTGRLRATIVGDSQDAEVERIVARLRAER